MNKMRDGKLKTKKGEKDQEKKEKKSKRFGPNEGRTRDLGVSNRIGILLAPRSNQLSYKTFVFQ